MLCASNSGAHQRIEFSTPSHKYRLLFQQPQRPRPLTSSWPPPQNCRRPREVHPRSPSSSHGRRGDSNRIGAIRTASSYGCERWQFWSGEVSTEMEIMGTWGHPLHSLHVLYITSWLPIPCGSCINTLTYDNQMAISV